MCSRCWLPALLRRLAAVSDRPSRAAAARSLFRDRDTRRAIHLRISLQVRRADHPRRLRAFDPADEAVRSVIDTDQGYAVLAICLLLLTWLFMTWIRRTDLGRAFLVVRENEVVARGMGINVPRTKMWAFLISGFFAGIAGGLLGFTDRLAHPEAFGMATFGRLYCHDHRRRPRVAYGIAARGGVCHAAAGGDPALWRGVWHCRSIVGPSRDGVRPCSLFCF